MIVDPPEPAGRRPRRDAQENRRRVIEAASRLFAEVGLDATMQQIADAAGVGVATIHRGFGSKRALQDEIFGHLRGAGQDTLAAFAEQPSAWAALCDWIRISAMALGRNQGLFEFTFRHGPAREEDDVRSGMRTAMERLVERAQAEGALRADFTAGDIPVITLMISRLAHTDPVLGPQLADRMLEVVLKGLRAGADPHPVAPPLSDELFEQWWRGLMPDPDGGWREDSGPDAG